MKGLHAIVFLLVVIGGLNWGLIGFFKYDLVSSILGDESMLTNVVFDLVGLSALYLVFTHKKSCKMCVGSSSTGGSM
ncbi:DUF378 domain-containing protein [Candidatus Parcubacteria bacterium]|nr:DUF378 domain-containing protein [Candidatus Parcubacteria bacterium]